MIGADKAQIDAPSVLKAIPSPSQYWPEKILTQEVLTVKLLQNDLLIAPL
jgi:hypothetical protein